MPRVLGRFSPYIYAALRIVAGLMFMTHGMQKLFGAFGSDPVPVGSLMGAAGIIELVCGALILVGFLGPIAAFIASGEMAAAYFIAHAPQGSWVLVNQGELAVLYCFIFLYIAAHGSGLFSLDGLIANARTHPRGGARPSEPVTGPG